MVGDFFPYSQENLGFDKPVTIVFQSDEENSSRMLGKTAHYDPAGMEVVLYVDGRHPKDIMRSLSHELVHHAQNCRGDFANNSATPEGYAQEDPHLRNMEREAYTKGNLIFRDYEDLIKTGKKEVDIDFSKSGEPKMSLKEWKNNEINTKLMKKWGFLNENKEVTTEGGAGDEHYQFDKKEREDELEEGCGPAYRDDEEGDLEEGMTIKGITSEGEEIELEEILGFDKTQAHGDERAWKRIAQGGTATRPRHHSSVKGHTVAPHTGGMELGDQAYEPSTPEEIAAAEKFKAAKRQESKKISENRSGKISIREAKQITRRIIERIRKEGK
tara:strand:+ start:1735 stop:2721 length:987 start_codon:yes stop_codon:yes gene_type:complete